MKDILPPRTKNIITNALLVNTVFNVLMYFILKKQGQLAIDNYSFFETQSRLSRTYLFWSSSLCSSLALGGVGGRLDLTNRMPMMVPMMAGMKKAMFMKGMALGCCTRAGVTP